MLKGIFDFRLAVKFLSGSTNALIFCFAVYLLFLTTSQNAQAQTDNEIEIGSNVVDHDKIIARRWVRVDIDPSISGPLIFRVNPSGNATLKFSLFQVVGEIGFGDDILIDRAGDNETPLEITAILSDSEQYYLGVWSASGSSAFIATAEPRPQIILHEPGSLDSANETAPEWVRLNFDTTITANHRVTVSWDSTADIRFRVREADGTFVSPIIEGSNPSNWSGQLLGSKRYFVSLWSQNGIGNYSVTVEAISDSCLPEITHASLNTDQQTMILDKVIDYGIADANAVLGQRHHVVAFSPSQTGPITIGLEWDSPQTMNLAVFDSSTGSRLAIAGEACTSGTKSSKAVSIDLVADKQYRATTWIDDGDAEWVMRKIQTVDNPNFGLTNAPDSAQKPNIVLINTDDQRSSTIDFLPAIQQLLVEKGTTYPNTIVPTPSCCPSRATTLSGQYVHNNQQFQQQRPNEQIFEKTIQKYLKQAGYFTGHAGKYLHWVERSDPVPPYWDRWTYLKGGFYDIDMNLDGLVIKPGGYTTDIVFERTKDYLREFETLNDDAPWFVYLAPTSPHRPYTAEYEFRNADVPELNSQSAAYLESDISDKPGFFQFRPMDDAKARDIHQQRARNLLSLDREVEQFINFLEVAGELDNTLIIFTSDNGYILGEHQTFGKFTPYRDSVEVPMVIRWPGNVPENVVNDSFVSHVDIVPTILDAAGINSNGIALDGRNIFDESRNILFMEYFLDSEANGGRIGDWASLRTPTYQYTEWYSTDGTGAVSFREYYDMVNDPYQLENLYENGNPNDDPDYTNFSLELLNARFCFGSSCP